MKMKKSASFAAYLADQPPKSRSIIRGCANLWSTRSLNSRRRWSGGMAAGWRERFLCLICTQRRIMSTPH